MRRCWARWDNRAPGPSPNAVYELGYRQDGVTFENVIGTRDLVPGGNNNGDDEPPFTIFRTQNSRLLGSIAYGTSTAVYLSANFISAYGDWGYQSDSDPHATDNLLLKDIVGVMHPSNPKLGNVAFNLYQDPAGHPDLPVSNTVDNLIGIVGGGKGVCQTGAWRGCNTIRTGTTIANAIGAGKSIWAEVPGICKRYINGVLTTRGLWPWPMNQRIQDALRQSGRTPVDVTATMAQLLGPIPQSCR